MCNIVCSDLKTAFGYIILG